MFDNAKYSKDAPLVSIIVITYNSSKYVIETLESAKNQTYKNIELIISDDCSIDGTVQVCKEWIIKNKQAFKRVELITVPENTGIPKNCNRGLCAAKGKWIKMIAGDDALFTTCIYDNIEFVKSNNKIKFCFSDFDSYKNNFDEVNVINRNDDYDARSVKFSELPNNLQLQVFMRTKVIYGATTFYHRESFVNFGGYDESYSFIEDTPTLYNWLVSGLKIYYVPKKTVKYRVNTDSISNINTPNGKINDFTIKNGVLIYDLFYKYFSIREKVYYHIKYSYYKFFINKTCINIVCRIFRRIWYYFLQSADRYNYKSLDRYYKEYKRNNSGIRV